ncbi:MAG: hypothetical protein M1818_001122 [Claussenomyces sp. TS43310]|nr:MAG: hypothetical protein M1818_001122 [Claussenomyces sp. TS43310]
MLIRRELQLRNSHPNHIIIEHRTLHPNEYRDTRSPEFRQHSSTSTLGPFPSDGGLSIERASKSSSLVHSILEAYDKDILEFASDQFLDLAVAIRFKSIDARELVGISAEAERLGYSKTDIIDDEELVCKGSPSRLDASGPSKPPATIDGQCYSISKASSQLPSFENSQASARTNTTHVQQGGSLSMNEHFNSDPGEAATPKKERSYDVQSARRVVSRREMVSPAARAIGRRGQREYSRVEFGPRVAAHITKSTKGPRAQQIHDMEGGVHIQNRRPRKLVKTSAARQSSLSSTKRTELVVISDSEPESEHLDDN